MAALTSRLIDQVNISHIARDAESNLCLRAGHREALKLLFRRATETSDPAAKDAIIAWMHHFDKMSFNHENEHLVEFCVNAVLQLLQRAPHQHASLGSALCRFIERLDASEELRAVLDKLTGVPQEDGFSRSVLTTSSLPAFCGVLRALGTSEAPLPLPADQTSMISKVLFSFLSQLSDAHADAEVSPEAEASAANLKSLLLYVLRRCLGQPEMLQSLQLKAPQAGTYQAKLHGELAFVLHRIPRCPLLSCHGQECQPDIPPAAALFAVSRPVLQPKHGATLNIHRRGGVLFPLQHITGGQH